MAKPVFTFDEDAIRRIARQVYKHERQADQHLLHRMMQKVPGQEPRRVRFRNTSGEEIPARGVMRVTGIEERFGKACFTVAKPDTSFSPPYLVNGPKPIGSGTKNFGWGRWMIEGVGRVLADLSTGTPAQGFRWGPISGSWKLAAHYQGFSVRSATTGTTHYSDAYVWATQDPILNDVTAFYNNSGEEIPAHAVMELTDTFDVSGRQYVVKPTTTFRRRYLVNGDRAVPIGKPGHGTYLERANNTMSSRVLCDTDPAIHSEFGVKPGEWKLFANRPGFHILGNSQATGGDFTARAIQREVTRLKGYLIGGAMTEGGSEDFTIYSGPTAAAVDAGFDDIECHNWGCAFSNGGEDLLGHVCWQDDEWQFEPDCCPEVVA